MHSTNNLTPPSSDHAPKCRHGQMSKWRQKGFVQDSDEEEEVSQLESQKSRQYAGLQGRVDRVDDITKSGQRNLGEERKTVTSREGVGEENAGLYQIEVVEEAAVESTARSVFPRRPTASPLTPAATYDSRRKPSESPDPLQSSPSPIAQRVRRDVSSQLLGSPTFIRDVTEPESRQHGITSPKTLNSTSSELRLPVSHISSQPKVASNILGAFGIDPLSDASDDDDLSDPPTDLESPETGNLSPQPHRRTAVQVVIPYSTALQRQTTERRSEREFRQRKPIQLHPYALESEMYRREVQSRGLKPVPRPRSPERRASHNDAETQEKEFDPNESPSSSPPELEIPVSTPLARGQRQDGRRGSSIRPPTSDPARRRIPATQLHYPHAAKRRKLNLPLTQIAAPARNIFDDEAQRSDIWSIPPNSPSLSSSPVITGRQSINRPSNVCVVKIAPNLPTPSTSSVFQDDPVPLLESDEDIVPRSTHRPSSELRRPTRITISEGSESDQDSASEAEQSDHEVRKVGKKIKGVLPASWLRIDRQAQERREALARERQRARLEANQSPEPCEPQRGVAKRVTKHADNERRAPSASVPADDVVLISDESDIESGGPLPNLGREVQHSVGDAVAIAAAFDRRYADNDSDTMENDRLHLFILGGPSTKRKKQTKLTDAFGKAKRLKTSNGTAFKSRHAFTHSRHSRTKRAQLTPLLAMSVVDVDLSPSKQGGSIPQFMRLARRQALRRPDLGRQSPWTKQIRLHNARDTEDANTALQRWRHGVLKPKNLMASQQRKPGRSPLVDRAANQQHTQWPTQEEDGRLDMHGAPPEAKGRTSHIQASSSRPVALQLFQRAATHRTPSSRQSREQPKFSKFLERSTRKGPLPFRIGQLEGDENVYGHGQRKIAFEKGLQRADQQPLTLASNKHSYMNPQLARFLSDEDAILPPLPSAKEIGECRVQGTLKNVLSLKQRLVRKKKQAHRIDVEAREFRQPSEPAVQEVLNTSVPEHLSDVVDEGKPTLHGLGSFGTRYPTTFDMSYLQPDTYFHASTLVGSEDLLCALRLGRSNGRDLDDAAGYYTISHGRTDLRCGPWNDETSSGLHDITNAILGHLQNDLGHPEQTNNSAVTSETWKSLTLFLRMVIQYVSIHLSFSDPADRRDFVVKMHKLVFSLFDQISVVQATSSLTDYASNSAHSCIGAMAHLLLLGVQMSSIAQHGCVELATRSELLILTRTVAEAIVKHVARKGISNLSTFLEQNKRHEIRQNGIQEDDVLVEGVVVCMHALERMNLPGTRFWDLVSQELTPNVTSATRLQDFESTWATIFTLLPYCEIDEVGIPSRDRRDNFSADNWTCISTILRRLLELYPTTYTRHSSSLNEYVRASLARCHWLIRHWHWQRPDHMLNAVFDFFGKNGLKQLRRETSNGSASFLDAMSTEQPLGLDPNEGSFHIALKCLLLGVGGMRKSYTDKKIRSFVFRTIPNHGRTYPKDQPLDEESLTALRNHHDLLCTLYWAAPPPCRPKLDLIRGLVSHETSHREACRVNVRAWSNLAAFQLSTDESYELAKPFALWHKEIMHSTLKQYRLARTEADDYLKSGVLHGTTDVPAVMVRQTMERNQEQVIATLRDCIAGMRKAMLSATCKTSIGKFLVDSDTVHLLELPHLEDRRLVNVIRDTLSLLKEYSKRQKALSNIKISQNTSQESQDYGDFPDLDEFDEVEAEPAKTVQEQRLSLDFIEGPLWHLLSNAFGAELSPDDNLLMDCVDTWVLVADAAVACGTRSWSYYIESFSQVSWQQLRHTEQTRKFGPYFLATLINCDSAAYEEHCQEVMTALLLSLVDREAMLRFQHRLLHAVVRADQNHPLMKNLPFFWSQESSAWDINAESVRSRRLALISSMLSNMRDDLYAVAAVSSNGASEVRRPYAAMLKDFMTRMKSNYQQLQQGSTVTGAYVEFVQKIVQFLKQYAGDICPVLPFFTDSVAFPLPSTDPTYVVGRLCGYAPKATDPGTAKQLSVFIQTVTQQAAAENQQVYLINQLTTALCSDEAPAVDRAAIRAVLLQGILPAYLEEAFASSVTLLIALPILQALRPILDTMTFDLRIHQPESVATIVGSIVVVSHAFIRGVEHLKTNPILFEQTHTLSALTYMFEAMCCVVPTLDYIYSRILPAGDHSKPPLIAYMEQFSIYVAESIHSMVPHTTPYYQGNAHAISSDMFTSLLAFSKRGLEDSLKANWGERHGTIRFGQGQAKREVVFDIGTLEEEKAHLVGAIETFHGVLRSVYAQDSERREVDLGCDIVV
ncbi:hypothetical protein EK21DRAFT_52273 [Setomelanomma holmii]|uniref:Uncharacterized protein n=1 Tax=Setomelanomma holmii TaxID=210430 RepID=A0A9P4HNA8_9PLEO|nr:hypothetical protein EK21DRAFT_52273 [Setomelanomma holmii]